MMNDQIAWKLEKFEALTPAQLYAVMQLRQQVFIVEQNCAYLDADGYDASCYHLMAWLGDRLVAYTRLVPPGVIYKEPSIGRVITSQTVRRTGIGKELMERSIENTYALFGEQPIKIGAQYYLKSFYQRLGFKQVSDVYLEDGIEHIYMIR